MNTKASAPSPTAGFTLVELVIVVVVIGVMAGLAAPAMTGMVRQSRLDGMTNQLTTDLAYARMVAVRSGEGVTLTFNNGGYEIRRTGAAEPIKRLRLNVDYPTITTLSATPSSLQFDSRGFIRSGGANIQATDASGRLRSLQITATGRLRRVN